MLDKEYINVSVDGFIKKMELNEGLKYLRSKKIHDKTNDFASKFSIIDMNTIIRTLYIINEKIDSLINDNGVDITKNYVDSLRPCSSDLNLILRKDFKHILKLYELAENEDDDFIKDIEKFDELVTKLETGEYKIIKVKGVDENEF